MHGTGARGRRTDGVGFPRRLWSTEANEARRTRAELRWVHPARRFCGRSPCEHRGPRPDLSGRGPRLCSVTQEVTTRATRSDLSTQLQPLVEPQPSQT